MFEGLESRLHLSTNWGEAELAASDELIPCLVANVLANVSPTAKATAPAITKSGGSTYAFTVRFSDSSGLKISTISDNKAVQVTGPGGFSQYARFVKIDKSTNGSPRVATYSIKAPGGKWGPEDNGTYKISIRPSKVRDLLGAAVAGGKIGSFRVSLTVPNNGGENTGSVTAAALAGPLVPGTRRVFDVIVPGASHEYSFATTVVGFAQIGGSDAVRVDVLQSGDGGDVAGTQYVKLDSNLGFVKYRDESSVAVAGATIVGTTLYNPPAVSYPPIMKVGTTYSFNWTGTMTSNINGMQQVSAVVSVWTLKLSSGSLQSVTVPAGTFQTYVLATTLSTTTNGNTQVTNSTIWPGVGTVKTVIANGSTHLLRTMN
jgi:hypothetical protein